VAYSGVGADDAARNETVIDARTKRRSSGRPDFGSTIETRAAFAGSALVFARPLTGMFPGSIARLAVVVDDFDVVAVRVKHDLDPGSA
jgi:hypothetical protein